MSYARDLDEYPTARLRSELDRREAMERAGLCHYCRYPLTDHTCRLSGRGKPPFLSGRPLMDGTCGDGNGIPEPVPTEALAALDDRFDAEGGDQ